MIFRRWLLIALAALCWCSSANAVITLAQAVQTSTTATATTRVYTVNSVVSGQVLVVGAIVYTNQTISSVAMSNGQSFTLTANQNLAIVNHNQRFGYLVANSSGNYTVTVTFSGSIQNGGFLAVLDGARTSTPLDVATTFAAATGTVTTTTDNAAIFALQSSSGNTPTASTGLVTNLATGVINSFSAAGYNLDGGAAGGRTVAFSGTSGTNGMAVLAIQAEPPAPSTAQVTHRLFNVGDELPHYDSGTQPVIEAADITHTNDTGADTSKEISYPAYSTGDLMIMAGFSDAAVTHTLPATGPNSAAITVLYEDQTPGAGGPTGSAFYWVANNSASSGTLTITLSANESMSGELIKVPAGEFDPNDPIGSISVGLQTSGTGPTIDTTAVNAGRSGSRFFAVGGVDADPMSNPFSPGSWTDRVGAARDDGDQNSFVATYDTSTTAGSSVASAAFSINAGDTAVVFAIEVHAPVTADGRTPFAVAGDNSTLAVDTSYGLNIRVYNSGSGPETVTAYKVQYKHTQGTNTWTDVSNASSVMRAQATADYADGDDVSEYIGGLGNYVINNNGAMDDDATFTLGAVLPAHSAIENHLTFQIRSADVADNDTIETRIVESTGSTVLDTYSDTLVITANEGGGGGGELLLRRRRE